MSMGSWLGSPLAPEFKEGLDWINTGGRAGTGSHRIVLVDTVGAIREVQLA